MINISTRLKTTAELVLSKKTNGIIDVGCDHALLDIYLMQNDETLDITASDINELPLENAKKNIERYSFLNKIKVCLKDGIKDIDEKIDTVIISGMGTETIIEILENGSKELTHISRLIISSNNKFEQLREKITKMGFIITNEKIVYEDGKYYIIIEFSKGKKEYTKKEQYFGPILLNNKDEMFKMYYNFLKNEKEYILKNLPETNTKKQKIIEELELLNEELM